MFGLGLQELVVILAIIVLLFGGKKIPELSKSLGQAIRDIKKGFTEDSEDKTKKEKAE